MIKHQITTLYLIRHGETENNEKKIFQGHSDAPATHLTAKGKKQVEKYAKQFEKIKFGAIFSSDLTRSRQTAEIIARERHLPVTTSPLLRGKCMGRYEGISVMEYRTKNKKLREQLKTLSETEQLKHKMAEDMESNEEVLHRLLKFLHEATTAHAGKNILVVTHGGAIRNLLFYLNWAKQQELKAGSVDNGGYIKITSDGTGFSLEKVLGVNKNPEIS